VVRNMEGDLVEVHWEQEASMSVLPKDAVRRRYAIPEAEVSDHAAKAPPPPSPMRPSIPAEPPAARYEAPVEASYSQAASYSPELEPEWQPQPESMQPYPGSSTGYVAPPIPSASTSGTHSSE
ncbi:unnamed protein product, partial [Polarella glacialis]